MTLETLARRNPDDEFLHQLLLEAYWSDQRQGDAERLVSEWTARFPSSTRLSDHLEQLKQGLVPPLFDLPGATPRDSATDST